MKKLLFVLMVLLALCGMAYAVEYPMEWGDYACCLANVSKTANDKIVLKNCPYTADQITDLYPLNTGTNVVIFKDEAPIQRGNDIVLAISKSVPGFTTSNGNACSITFNDGTKFEFVCAVAEFISTADGKCYGGVIPRDGKAHYVAFVRPKGRTGANSVFQINPDGIFSTSGTGTVKNEIYYRQFRCTGNGTAVITLGNATVTTDFYLNGGIVPTGITTEPEDQTYYEIFKGQTINLDAKVTPEGADQRVVLSTDFLNYLDVDNDGNVTGLNVTPTGVSYPVVVTSAVQPDVSKTVYVMVKPEPVITITKEDGTVPTKVKTDVKSTQFVAAVSPADAPQEVVWSSSDESVLKVDENGLVTITATEAGHSATITATSVAVPSVSASIELKAFICIKGLDIFYNEGEVLNPDFVVLKPGDSASFAVKFNPANPTDRTMTWKNQKSAVASVKSEDDYNNNVTITAIAGGQTQICAVAKSGHGKDFWVYVPWFKVNKPSINVKVGETAQTKISHYPTDLPDRTVNYVIDDPEIISIDDNGVITGLKAGTTTAYAVDAYGVTSDVIAVTVKPADIPVESINFTDTKLFLHTNDEYTFKVIFNPSDATDKRLKWKVSNKSVLSVVDGKIVALANGFSKVEAWSVDGKKVAICDVYVTDHVSDFKLSKASVTLGVGETTRIVASFKPQQLAGTVEWWVNDDTVAAIDTNNTVCNITGVGLGDTKVYARVDGITLECVVTVEEPKVIEE